VQAQLKLIFTPATSWLSGGEIDATPVHVVFWALIEAVPCGTLDKKNAPPEVEMLVMPPALTVAPAKPEPDNLTVPEIEYVAAEGQLQDWPNDKLRLTTSSPEQLILYFPLFSAQQQTLTHSDLTSQVAELS
jgi:hypothetical protein